MGIFARFKKESNNERIIATGRDFGSFFINGQKEPVYAVGSAFDLVQLTIGEYKIWKVLKSSRSIIEWQRACIEKELLNGLKEFDKIKVKFEKHHLFQVWNKQNLIASLKGYTVSKNGSFVNYSSKENKWIITSVHPNKTISLNEEQYQVWRAGNGITTFQDVIPILIDIMKTNQEEVIKALLKIAPTLIAKDLWNVEYFGGSKQYFTNELVIGSTISSEHFDESQLSPTTNVLAVGHELGYESIDNVNSQVIILIANNKVLLDSKEALIWKACQKGVLNIQSIAETLSMDIEKVMHFIRSLIEKKATLKWTQTLDVDKNFVISLCPKGIGIGTKDNQDYKILDVTNGEIQTCTAEEYMIWAFSHSYVPLSVVVERYKEFFNLNQEDASYRTAQLIRLLMKNGLANLNIIPDKPYIEQLGQEG